MSTQLTSAVSCRALAALAVVATLPAGFAHAMPDLFYNADIISFDLSGTAGLALGANGEVVQTQINMTRATDHNSSRSNKTSRCSTIAPDPDGDDDINPGELIGQEYELYTRLDIQFVITLTDIDPAFTIDPIYGNAPAIRTSAPVIMTLEERELFTFDPDDIGFGVIRDDEKGRGRATGRRQHGPITLASPQGGQGAGGGLGGPLDSVLIPDNSLVLTYVDNTSSIKELPGGTLEHAYDMVLTFDNQSGTPSLFDGVQLQGTFVERGQILNTIVPVPSAAGLFAVAGAAAMRRRRG